MGPQNNNDHLSFIYDDSMTSTVYHTHKKILMQESEVVITPSNVKYLMK